MHCIGIGRKKSQHSTFVICYNLLFIHILWVLFYLMVFICFGIIDKSSFWWNVQGMKETIFSFALVQLTLCANIQNISYLNETNKSVYSIGYSTGLAHFQLFVIFPGREFFFLRHFCPWLKMSIYWRNKPQPHSCVCVLWDNICIYIHCIGCFCL